MTPEQAQQYVENCLQQLGWSASLVTREAAELICELVNGDQSQIGQLCNMLVSRAGKSRKEYRITRAAVRLAIRDLSALDESRHPSDTETPDGPPMLPDRPTDNDIASIEQLAAELERKMAGASSQAEAARQTQAAQSQEDSGKPKLVIVDDSPTVRTVINTALGNDFVCVEAKDGEVAWDMLLTDPRIAVAIVDLEMPALDGYGLIRRIRAAHIARIAQMPIIVVTSATDTIAKKEAYLAGADDFISKTSDPLDLLVRVRTHFRLAQTKSELEHERHVARSNAALKQGTTTPSVPNQDVARPSQPPKIQGSPTTSKGASNRAVQDRGQQQRVSPSLTAPLRRPAPDKDTRTHPIVTMTVAATVLVVIVIGFVKYQNGIEPMQTAENTDLAGTEQVTAEPPPLGAHEQPADPSMSVAQENLAHEDLVAEEPRADDEFSSRPTDQLADVSNVTQDTIVALQDDPSSAAEQQKDQFAATGEAKAPAASEQSTAFAPAVMQQGSTVVAGSQSAAASTTKEPERLATAPAREVPREAPTRTSSPESTTVRSIPAPAEAPAWPPQKESATATGIRKDQNIPAYAAAGASLETAKTTRPATRLDTPSPSITSASVDTRSTSFEAASQDLAARAITRAEVRAMLRKFVASYEAGNLNEFMNLFSEQARTNERVNRDGIRQDYVSLFRTTAMRRMELRDVTWNLANNQAQGLGNFNVQVQKKGEGEVRTYTGSLSLSIEREGQELRITRLYHHQSKTDVVEAEKQSSVTPPKTATHAPKQAPAPQPTANEFPVSPE